jgi:hypothetical protein
MQEMTAAAKLLNTIMPWDCHTISEFSSRHSAGIPNLFHFVAHLTVDNLYMAQPFVIYCHKIYLL